MSKIAISKIGGKYPVKIIKEKNTGIIVMFTADGTGIILLSENRLLPIGTFHKFPNPILGKNWEILNDVTINFKSE
jgi:hypothetical protein